MIDWGGDFHPVESPPLMSCLLNAISIVKKKSERCGLLLDSLQWISHCRESMPD